MIEFAQIEEVMTRNCMSTAGFCSMFEIKESTFYEWKSNGVPTKSKLLPMLRMFIRDPIPFIREHAEEFEDE